MNKNSFIGPSDQSSRRSSQQQHQQHESDEIFHKEQEKLNYHEWADPMSWLRDNFFLADKRVLFGTWNGVFTSIILNIFGVLIYLRAGWMVANAGLLQTMLVVVIAFAISFVTISSSIALSEKCKLNHEANIRGGIFYLLSNVLGIKVAVCVGLFYCFGQAVNLSLTLTAFGESICFLFQLTDEQNLVLSNFISRFVAVLTLLFILGVNIAGVKWILRLQIILLVILVISFVDLVIGSFTHVDPENGILGYSYENFLANMHSNYSIGENIFSVYGVFFPATTGIFTGLNMAYELKTPGRSIPIGTYGGILCCFLLYAGYIFIFGSVVLRSFLYTDFFIGEKISYTGYLFLVGFYVCSISSSIGSFYAPSRLIQSMAKQELFPKFLDILKTENGKNKLPIPAILLVSMVTFAFTIVGQINILAPIIAMPYMMTYAAVNYAFFALKTCEDRELSGQTRVSAKDDSSSATVVTQLIDENEACEMPARRKSKSSEKEILLPDLVLSSSSSESTTKMKKRASYGGVATMGPDVDTTHKENEDESQMNKIDFRDVHTSSQVDDVYMFSRFSNKWISILGALGSIVSMILVNYVYALVSFVVCYLIFLQLRFYKPGLPKGSSHLNLDKHIFDFFSRLVHKKSENTAVNRVKSWLRRKSKNENEFMVVIKPVTGSLTLETKKSQISVENVDYSGRKPYHHYDHYGSITGH